MSKERLAKELLQNWSHELEFEQVLSLIKGRFTFEVIKSSLGKRRYLLQFY